MSTRTTTHSDANVVQHPDGVERGTTLPAGRYLSIREAAAELKVGYTAIWQAIRNGRILAVDIDGAILVSSKEVAHYRDTRRASRGHTDDELKRQRKAAAKVQAPKPLGEWKRKRVYYRLISGRQIVLTVNQARILAAVGSYDTAGIEAKLVDDFHRATRDTITRAKIITSMEVLIQAGLVQRIRHRDAKGGAMSMVYLGVNGHHALRYCRDRRLI